MSIVRQAVGRTALRLLLKVGVLGLVVLFSCLPARAGEPGTTRMVVVLYPDGSDGRPGDALMDQGIRTSFATASEPIDCYNEHLDIARNPDAEQQKLQAELLRRKYAGRKVDLVITVFGSALHFMLKHRQDLFPGIPIVFCALEEREIQALKMPTDVIGIPARVDVTATLELALRLHPRTQRIFVIAGKSRADEFWLAQARRSFGPYQDRLEFTYLTDLPLDDLLQKVTLLPERSILYYLHVNEDSTGKVCVPADVLERLASGSNSPLYGHIDSFVGRGIVGGSVVSLELEGKGAARIGLRILAGEQPEKIGIQETSENAYLFDWRQLQRWGINEGSLPPGSIIRARDPSFWELYKWLIVGVVVLCVVETLLIAGLVVQRSNRRKAELRFRQVVEAAPTGMLMVEKDGKVVLANAQMETLFGYTREELLGQPIEILLPERFRDQHPTYRAAFFASAEVRLMRPGLDLLGRRKDGSEFPVTIALSPVMTDAGLFVLASIIDISERKQAEENLFASRRELRVLTGRLLQAQETERRRIARELHDDLSQNLALLAVELDLLGRKPSDSSSSLAGQMQELSTRVKQCSSSVHDLSHRLHPAKLEQVGLVAAIRGMCEELKRNHHLPIEFSHHEVPDPLPEEVALCLYRIAQEALANVLAHSGARHAELELTGAAGGLCLSISDDGTGFEPESIPRSGGLGLVSMRERLHLVDGEIAIDSHPNEGTRIEVRVPLETLSSRQVAGRDSSGGSGARVDA